MHSRALRSNSVTDCTPELEPHATIRTKPRRIRLEYVPIPTKGGFLDRRGYLTSTYAVLG